MLQNLLVNEHPKLQHCVRNAKGTQCGEENLELQEIHAWLHGSYDVDDVTDQQQKCHQVKPEVSIRTVTLRSKMVPKTRRLQSVSQLTMQTWQ